MLSNFVTVSLEGRDSLGYALVKKGVPMVMVKRFSDGVEVSSHFMSVCLEYRNNGRFYVNNKMINKKLAKAIFR